MKTNLFLVRHGETMWNTQGRFQGQKDSPLTDLGIAQATAVGQRLQKEAITALYSSDLGRSARTAEFIGLALDLPVQFEVRFRERHYGVFEGLTQAEAKARYPTAYQLDGSKDPTNAVPEGESRQALLERVWEGIEILADRHVNETIAVVTHGAVLSGIIRHILDIPFGGRRSFRLRNGSVHHLVRDDEGWIIEMLGDTHHLKHVSARDSRS